MVSHDVEFCARYADRCAMFFDGGVGTQGPPREFFSGNSFYTTVANRMARSLLPGGGEVPQVDVEPALLYREKTEEARKKREEAPLPGWRKGLLCAALLLMIWVVRGAPSRRGFWSPD